MSFKDPKRIDSIQSLSFGGLLGRLRRAAEWRANLARHRMARWVSRLRRHFVSLSEEDVFACLQALGAVGERPLFVHSALSACGIIQGGPGIVIRALCRWIENGTLVLPTHTYCYPEAGGKVPVFRVGESASRVGAITEYFWRQPGVLRSAHPSHSLAALGPSAQAIVTDHESCETPCGAGTPYSKLVESDCAVLMFGARLDSYTLFHTAEDAAAVPYLYYAAPLDLKVDFGDGVVRTVRTRRQDARVPRRFVQMDAWLESKELLLRQRLGFSELLFLPSAKGVHDAVVAALRDEPLFLVAPTARSDVAARCGLTAPTGSLTSTDATVRKQPTNLPIR